MNKYNNSKKLKIKNPTVNKYKWGFKVIVKLKLRIKTQELRNHTQVSIQLSMGR
jgi:hypothetical protein